MKADSFLSPLQRLYRNFPIRINLFALVTLSILVFYNLKFNSNKDNSYADLIWIMAKIGAIMVGIIIVFSILVTATAWFRLRFILKNNPELIMIAIRDSATTQNLNLTVAGSVIPFLGYIDICFAYNNITSPLFRLHMPKRFFKTKIEGTIDLHLPDIKVYEIDHCHLYIKDMLQLVSLPLKINIKKTLYNTPLNQSTNAIESTPRKTIELDVKINELRKSEGEWLHYKNFENNDDVRRIVWKIFAKNKELVVRNPEIFNPYASRIDILSSFHHTVFIKSSSLNNQLLNFYKNMNWTIFEALSKSEFNVNYSTDQSIQINEIAAKEQHPVAATITVQEWQTTIPIVEKIGTKNLAAIIIHSLNQIDDIRESIEHLNKHTIIYFVPLSKGVRQNIAGSLLYNLFFIQSSNDMKYGWLEWSDLKLIKQQEGEIISLLENAGKKYAIVA